MGLVRRRFAWVLVTVLLAFLAPAVTTAASEGSTQYMIGRGIADVTGAAAENGMAGYSKIGQNTTGIQTRLRSRAFVIVDSAGSRVVHVTADLWVISGAVHTAVLRKLEERYRSLYTVRNVMLTATHSHSGPGGHTHDLAYNLAPLGFQEATFNAAVDGIFESIIAAHADLRPGSVSLTRGQLTNASVNRSRTAFDRDPPADRMAFPNAIDPAVTVLNLFQDGLNTGQIAWFATHNTSMTNNNTLISGDNKGVASYLVEHEHNGVRYLDGKPSFVAAFPQTNAGDMSPNLNLRPGSGPTENEVQNMLHIGQRQADAAFQSRLHNKPEPITGAVDARTAYRDMSNVTVSPGYSPTGQPVRTCTGAVGVSTLAGSIEDGPGLAGLQEGSSSPAAPLIAQMSTAVAPEEARCQAPKQVALVTGSMQATPNVLPLQLVKLGQLYLIGTPAEVTIVAGLRLRRTVAQELGVPLENVLVQGYANSYSQYITTPEEYDVQHYEGGSTLFGRNTLPAYRQEFAGLASALRSGSAVATGSPAPTPAIGRLNVQTGVVFDDTPLDWSRWWWPRKTGFGEVLVQPRSQYSRRETVSVEFRTGHPKNDLRRNGTFLQVQRLVNGTWTRVADDGDLDTTYQWRREGLAYSRATITWTISRFAPGGQYRIVHHGAAKNPTGAIISFTGVSNAFVVP